MGHFTVMDGSEADGDPVSIVQGQFRSKTKQRSFVSKRGYRQPHIHSKTRVLSPQL